MASNSQEEYLDNETGEKSQIISAQKPSTDAETGEPELEERTGRKFRIPRRCLQQYQYQEKGGRKLMPRRPILHGFYWRKQEIRTNVVKELLLCKRNVTPIVFMLPTLFICPAWASLLCLLGEAWMHIWSHKRNWKKKNINVEYRSPFHLISSHFCAYCRSQKWAEKIGQIQDKRNLRRRILYPNIRGRMPY